MEFDFRNLSKLIGKLWVFLLVSRFVFVVHCRRFDLICLTSQSWNQRTRNERMLFDRGWLFFSFCRFFHFWLIVDCNSLASRLSIWPKNCPMINYNKWMLQSVFLLSVVSCSKRQEQATLHVCARELVSGQNKFAYFTYWRNESCFYLGTHMCVLAKRNSRTDFQLRAQPISIAPPFNRIAFDCEMLCRSSNAQITANSIWPFIMTSVHFESNREFNSMNDLYDFVEFRFANDYSRFSIPKFRRMRDDWVATVSDYQINWKSLCCHSFCRHDR